ncbi:MAG: rod shape-determining protein MreD [Selenomonadaceae bacterium]|nr:rod shape-determining protein MreD [Selenomonadaceae bacterium]MDY2684726.1 rod shape-determining protein MreD [Selenomonadaceae bacterium]
MKRFGILTAIVAGLFVLQTSLLPMIAYHGVSADLLLLLVVSFAFLRGVREGALMGFLTGLLQDLATGTFFGVNTFTYLVLGLFFGSFSGRIFKEQFFLPVLCSLPAAAASYFILAVLMVLLGYRFNLTASMQYTLLPMFVYQLVFAYPVHRIAYAIDTWLSEKN